jgi:hypothetical protein
MSNIFAGRPDLNSANNPSSDLDLADKVKKHYLTSYRQKIVVDVEDIINEWEESLEVDKIKFQVQKFQEG